MSPLDIAPQLDHPSPCFLCSNLTDRKSTRRYRVPLGHIQFDALLQDLNPTAAAAAIDALPDIPSAQQLRALTQDRLGLGIWAPQSLLTIADPSGLSDLELQARAGSVIIFPPAEWAHLRTEFADWQDDGVEAAFEGLPYSFDDILLFAGPNYSPNRWFLVLRGPMAGNVCWWTHDGDSVMNKFWATDIRDWARRIFTDPLEDTLGGLVRFTAADSIDPAPDDAELYPLEYRAETPPSAD